MADEKMTEEQFILTAIEKLRDPKKSKGIHARFSGFTEAFRKYFDGANVVEAVKRLEAAGVVVTKPVKAGVMIYKKGEEPTSAGTDALSKIVG